MRYTRRPEYEALESLARAAVALPACSPFEAPLLQLLADFEAWEVTTSQCSSPCASQRCKALLPHSEGPNPGDGRRRCLGFQVRSIWSHRQSEACSSTGWC